MKNITMLEFAAESPDLNPIENPCLNLMNRIYAGGHKYENLSEVKVEEKWRIIEEKRGA